MPDTGWRTPSTAATISGNTGGPWTNPGNITALDSAGATASALNTLTELLVGKNYGFSVPSVVGIEVEHTTIAYTGTTDTPNTQLTKNGTTVVGTGKSTGGGGIGTVIMGSPTDLWGTTWTAAEINAATFGVIFNGMWIAAGSISVDSMRIRVYYTTGGIATIDLSKQPRMNMRH